ncbi:hypothetical protein CAEBREN_25199 [Caenorhabditis brenneri]|uniref:GATA-type domain-containing protein n=1 Tax=Caenorhabditis brenneri TaxID=135651 RepID=G0PDI1_CAEBE|nr:hypothetical protein CAEBREN_25199 [Caenorhabditis brenneri]
MNDPYGYSQTGYYQNVENDEYAVLEHGYPKETVHQNSPENEMQYPGFSAAPYPEPYPDFNGYGYDQNWQGYQEGYPVQNQWAAQNPDWNSRVGHQMAQDNGYGYQQHWSPMEEGYQQNFQNGDAAAWVPMDPNMSHPNYGQVAQPTWPSSNGQNGNFNQQGPYIPQAPSTQPEAYKKPQELCLSEESSEDEEDDSSEDSDSGSGSDSESEPDAPTPPPPPPPPAPKKPVRPKPVRPEDRKCSNCGTKESNFWKNLTKIEEMECNSCYQYKKSYGKPRPEHLWSKEVVSRKTGAKTCKICKSPCQSRSNPPMCLPCKEADNQFKKPAKKPPKRQKETKTCTKCGATKTTEFHGRVCKDCANAEFLYRRNLKEKGVKLPPPRTLKEKTCATCGLADQPIKCFDRVTRIAKCT